MESVRYLIANYNYGRFIRKAIDSALNQTYPIKLCIGDDASTDDSTAIIKEYFPNATMEDKGEYLLLEENDNIFVQLKKQTGPSHVRNLLIQETILKTDYYAILDADDTNHPTKIEKALQIMRQYPSVGIVYADYYIKRDDGLILPEYKESFSYPRLLQECIIHSGSIIRKEALEYAAENTGWYDFRLRCSEDYDLWLRICEKYIAYHIPELLSTVLVHKNNSTNSVSQEIWQSCWQLTRQKLEQRHAKS